MGRGRKGKRKVREGRGSGGRDVAHPKILAWRPDANVLQILKA